MNGYLWVEPMATTTNTFMTKVYNWMSVALLISWGLAYYIGTNIAILKMIMPYFIPLIILELVVVMILSWAINRIWFIVAIILFIIYSALNWITLSVIFQVYTWAMIANTFIITAWTFLFMSAYWYYTKADLTGFWTFLIMWLFWLILASIVNFFLKSNMFDYILSWAWVLIFTGLIAYDTQKIKQIWEWVWTSSSDWINKRAIIWALALYLDFINLFLFILRLFNRRD